MKKPEIENVAKSTLKGSLWVFRYITWFIARSQQIIYAIIVIAGLNTAYHLTKSNYQGDFVLFEKTETGAEFFRLKAVKEIPPDNTKYLLELNLGTGQRQRIGVKERFVNIFGHSAYIGLGVTMKQGEFDSVDVGVTISF